LQWQNGRRGQDGWGRWTRRRKWYRDAELVEADDVDEAPTNGTAVGTGVEKTPVASPTRRTGKASGASASTPSLEVTDTQTTATTSSSGKQPDIQDLDREREDDYDGASMLSTSSRSTRFKTLRRRATDSSQSHRSRRTSVTTSEDDAAALGTQVGLALQDAGKEGGSWGFGDEVRMGLE
jgi:hypothetical protein